MDKQMSNQVLQALRKIRNDSGEDIFSNEKLFKNKIDGLLPGRDMINTRECLVLAIKSNAYNRLKEAVKKDDISLESLSLANIILQKNKKADLNFAKAVINTLADLCKEEPIPVIVQKTVDADGTADIPKPEISAPVENIKNIENIEDITIAPEITEIKNEITITEKTEKNEKKSDQDILIEMQMGAAKKARIPDILSVITGVIILFVFAAAIYIIPDKTFSDQENRVLQQFPPISSQGKFLDRLVEGKFTVDMAKYYADQFPFRDQFVGLKGLTEIALLKGENDGVILGKNNYLITKDSYSEIDQLIINIDHISEFATSMNVMKIPVTLAAAGRSIDALSSYLPGAYPRTDSDSLWSSFNGLSGIAANVKGLNLLDPLRKLIEAGNKGQIYYRTDHHWTTLGAYYAYVEILKSFNKEDLFDPLPLSAFTSELASDSFYGTTWSKAGLKWIEPDKMYYFRYDGDEDFVTTIVDTGQKFNGFYDRSYLELKDKYSSFIGGNNARVDISKPGGNSRPKLLIIKDSFAHAVVPFLAYHYDLVILDLRYYTESVAKLVYNEKINRILFLHNISNLSQDDIYGILQYGVENVLKNYAMDQYPVRNIFINNNNIKDYVIICPADDNEKRQQNYMKAIENLRDTILQKTGIKLEIVKTNDWSGMDKIIAFSREGLPANSGFIKIAVEGNNLIFRCNIGDDHVTYSLNRFVPKYLGKNAAGSFNFGSNFLYTDIGDDVIMIKPGQ